MSGDGLPPVLDDAARIRLGAWIGEHLRGWSSDGVAACRLTGGSSATVLRLDQRDRKAVLRAPMIPPRADSGRALAREARVLKALGTSDVPHPRFLGYCEDEAVIGMPFLLIEWVEGWPGADPVPPPLRGSGTAHALAFSLIDALAALHRFDYVAAGLENFGRPEGFLDRQVAQWTALFEKHRADPSRPSRVLPHVPEIGAWLVANRPARSDAALIHADASFSNVMFRYDAPELAALIDWEIATIGDPLLDLGRAAYPFPDERGAPGVVMLSDHSAGPSRQALAARYERRSGRSAAALDYYMVLAMFKLAALIEPNYARHVMGLDPTGLSGRVADFILELLEGCRVIMAFRSGGGQR